MTITDTINRTVTRTLDRLDVSKLTHVDLSRLDVRNVTLPTFELPKFDLPKFELPKFELPERPTVDLPVAPERIAGWVRDAAYVGVGAAVVVGQQAEQRVRSVATTVSGAVSDAVTTVADAIR